MFVLRKGRTSLWQVKLPSRAALATLFSCEGLFLS